MSKPSNAGFSCEIAADEKSLVRIARRFEVRRFLPAPQNRVAIIPLQSRLILPHHAGEQITVTERRAMYNQLLRIGEAATLWLSNPLKRLGTDVIGTRLLRS